MSLLSRPSSLLDGGIRKRVGKACDRCRIKKSKCDGASPCSRCKADNIICVFDGRKKSVNKAYTRGYVEMLENQQSQLVDALQEMCKRMQSGHGWPGSPLGKTSHGISLANEILENARLLKLEDNDPSVNFHEDRHTENSEHRASGDRTNASKNPQPGTYSTISPAFELLPSKSEFSKLFPPSDFPPTPDESPPLQSSRTVTQNEALQYSHPATQPELAWSREPSKAADPVDVISQYDSSEMGNNTAFTSFVVRMDNEQMAPTVINPIFANGTPHCVIVSPKALCREWPPEDSDYADSWIAVTSQNPHGGAF